MVMDEVMKEENKISMKKVHDKQELIGWSYTNILNEKSWDINAKDWVHVMSK